MSRSSDNVTPCAPRFTSTARTESASLGLTKVTRSSQRASPSDTREIWQSDGPTMRALPDTVNWSFQKNMDASPSASNTPENGRSISFGKSKIRIGPDMSKACTSTLTSLNPSWYNAAVHVACCPAASRTWAWSTSQASGFTRNGPSTSNHVPMLGTVSRTASNANAPWSEGAEIEPPTPTWPDTWPSKVSQSSGTHACPHAAGAWFRVTRPRSCSGSRSAVVPRASSRGVCTLSKPCTDHRSCWSSHVVATTALVKPMLFQRAWSRLRSSASVPSDHWATHDKASADSPSEVSSQRKPSVPEVP